jgi:hypothetical protein
MRACPALFALCLAACNINARALGYSSDGGDQGELDGSSTTVWVPVEPLQNLKTNVDILFLIDDSGSMSPKVEALKTLFPSFIASLDDYAQKGHPLSYHIGVVTSDLGAPGINCGSNLGAKLQQRGRAVTNTPGCEGPLGANFIRYDQRTDENNLPVGQDLSTTFSCMASVVDPDDTVGGHWGCGFEMQLEAVYRALHDPIPENIGFLRYDASLVVIFVTDEDDCSVDDPMSDLFSNNPSYGPLNSYRCAQFGIVCDGMLLPSSPQASLQNCTAALPWQGGKLADVQKYINFFTEPSSKGGVKADPRDVLIATLAAPPTPIGTVESYGAEQCGVDQSQCTTIAHSCVAADNANFFGDPAVRLSLVASKAMTHRAASICDNLTMALTGIGDSIEQTVQPRCITSPLLGGAAHPDCLVADNTDDGHGTITSRALPFCADETMARPCWATVVVPDCPAVCNPTTGIAEQIGIRIDRAGLAAPPNTSTTASCATVPADGSAPCGTP